MNIWIVNHYAIPPSLGGLNRHYYFSRELEKRGHKVSIITSSKIHNNDNNFIEKGKLFTKKSIDGVYFTFVKSLEYKGNGIGRIASFLQFPLNAWRTMRRLMKEERPDVIYTSSPEIFTAAMAVWYGKKHNIPLVVEVRDAWPDSIVVYSKFTERNPIIKILYRVEKWIYRNANQLIFTWEGGKKYIRDKKWDLSNGGDINLEKVFYVNNGVDLSIYDDIDKNSKSNDKFIVTYTGSIRRVNRIDFIVEAARRLSNEKDILFNIYGEGNCRKDLEKKADSYGLKNIKFFGHIDKKDIPKVLGNSSLNIMVGESNYLDQYGASLNKLFDYMASGKPVLSNIQCGFDNIIKYNFGLVVKPDSVDALCDGIISIKALNDDKYMDLCNNALKAGKEFSYPQLSLKIEEILKLAVKEKGCLNYGN